MKNLKRLITLLLVSVLLVTPFAAIPAFAAETEAKAFWHFSYNGFEHGATAEELVVKEYYEEGLGDFYDYTELYDTWEAYVETEDGERVSGELQPNTEYILAIRIDGLSSKLAKYTSLVTLANLEPNTDDYYYYYQDESCVIAKFRIGKFYDEIEGEFIFNIEGYQVGADINDLKVTCNNESINIWKIEVTGPTPDLSDKPIRNGIVYELNVGIFPNDELLDTHYIDYEESTFILRGLGEDIIGQGVSFRSRVAFDLPVLGDSLPQMEGLEFSVEGYSYGNTFSDISVKTENELISNVSVRETEETVFVYGERYWLNISFEIPEGYDIENGVANILLVDSKEEKGARIGRYEKYEKFAVNLYLPILYIDGDVDFDGVHTVSDALMLLRIAAKTAYEQDHTLTAGDLDGDGEISVSDALAVLRLAAKLN